MPIPARVHFCWIGTEFPWAYAFAVLSAAERSGAPVTLHHTDALADGAPVRALRADARVRVRPLDGRALLRRVGAALGLGDALVALHDRLDRAVIRSDLLRAALLFDAGGFYLDLDTVTVRSLLPLASHRNVVGAERVVWTASARTSRAPSVLLRHMALDIGRKICKALPRGWALFRRVEHFYPMSLSNAVIGAEAGSTLFAAYLRAMATLDRDQQQRLYALGPRLLGGVVAQHPDEVTVLDPAAFYPLAPEISAHWFRAVCAVRPELVLAPETRVVHWYASVQGARAVAALTPASVRHRRRRQLWSALVDAHVPGLGSSLTAGSGVGDAPGEARARFVPAGTFEAGPAR